MKLFRYELNKLFGEKPLIVLLAVFFAASAVIHMFYLNRYKVPSIYTDEQTRVINEFVREYGYDDEKYNEFKDNLQKQKNKIGEQINAEVEKAFREGKSEEEINAIWSDAERFNTNIYSDVITDDILLSELARRKAAQNEFLSTVGIITKQAENNAKSLREKQGMGINDPLYQYQVYVYNTYDTVAKNAEVGIKTVVGWDKLLTYTYSDIFLFISLILLAGAVFLYEDRCYMSPILRAAKKGRLSTGLAKISVMICGGAVSAIIYSLSSFLIVLLTTGFSDPNISVQNIKAFTAFPYVFSILQYYLYGLMLKVLSAAAFAMLCGFLAAAIRNQVFYYISSASLFGVMFAVGKLPATQYPAAAGFNLYSICNVVPLSDRLYVFQPFVTCNSYYLLAPVFCGIIIFISSFSAVIIFCNVRYAARTRPKLISNILSKIKIPVKPKRKISKSKANRSQSIFLWECRKALNTNLPLLILTIVLTVTHIGVCIAGRIVSEPDREQRIYNRFILPEVAGNFSETGDKCGFMIDIFTAADKEKYERMFSDALGSGVIDAEEGDRIRATLEFINKNVLNGYFNYAKEIHVKNAELYEQGCDAAFIDESGVLPVVTSGASYPLYAAILFICTVLFTIEYGGKSKNENFANILRTAKNGRKKTFVSKLCAAAAISAALSAVFNVFEFVILTAGRELSCINVPLYSVTAFSDAGISFTVLQYLIFMYVCRVVITVLFSVFVCAVASLLRNLTASVAVSAGATVLPTMLFSSGFNAAGYASFSDFFGVNGMTLFSSTEGLFGSSFGVFILYAAIFTTITAVLTFAAYKKFVK